MEFEYRLVTEEDASAYRDFFRSIAGESDNLACSAEEADAMSIEDERSFIRNSAASGWFSAVAVLDGRICGSCDIRVSQRERIRHRGEMGIAVRKEYWGKGVAQHIFDTAVSEARRRGIRKISLTVRSDNERAKAFYRKNGFSLCGTDRMLFLIDGKYVDGQLYDLILD